MVITLGYPYTFLTRYFGSIQPGTIVQHPYAMANEFFSIYICRQPKRPLDEIWAEFKNWN